MSASPATARVSDVPPLPVATPTTLEQITKPVLLLSLAGAMWAATWGVSVSMPSLRTLVPLGLLLAWPAAQVGPALVRTSIIGSCYVLSGVFAIVGAPFPAGHWLVWMAPLAGCVAATMPWRRWAMPSALKVPLASWALIVAATWPIVVLREADFVWSRIHPATASWAGVTAAALILGILWFDSLFAAFPRGGHSTAAFERQVVLPLAAGWLVAAAVGVYQMFVDISFLNHSLWGLIHRARGTLPDANPFGVVSAIWGPVIFAVAIERWSGWRRMAGAAALPLSWLAVWSSGSRSSLPIAVLGLVFLVVRYVAIGESRRLKRLAVAAALLGGVGVAGTIATRWSGVDSPLARANANFAPRFSIDWAAEVASRLQTRDGYGTLGTAVIKEFPFTGVGVSAFHILVPTYAWKVLHTYIPPDNAQNWFRHQLAELGLVGSLGAIVFALWLFTQLAIGRASPNRPLTSGALRSVLLGFGVISLVGMPAQDIAVMFTFWTLTFWFLSSVEPRDSRAGRLSERRWWVAVWIVVLTHTVATIAVGRTELRPPMRAASAELPYSYGFYPPEPGATVRWASKRAVDVMPVPAAQRWLQVAVQVQHIDLPTNPVDVKVWTNGRLLLSTRLTTIEPVTRSFKVPDGDTRVVLETWVSRALRPRDFGVPDDRELGLLVDYKFVEAPPSAGVP